VQAVAFSPDGTVIASGSLDRTIRLCDPATGACTRTMAPQQTAPSAPLAFHAGFPLAAGGGVVVHRCLGCGYRPAHPLVQRGTILEIAVTAGGERLVTGSRDCIRVWELSEGGAFTLLPTSVGTLFRVAFSPDGGALAVGGARGTELWDVRTRSKTLAPDDLGQSVARLSFSPDGCTLVTVARDRTVRLWDVCTGACEATMMVYGWSTAAAATGAAFTPDWRDVDHGRGEFAAVLGSGRGQLLRTLDTTRALPGVRPGSIRRAGAHDSSAAAACTSGKRRHGRVLAELGTARRVVLRGGFSPDGRTAAVAIDGLARADLG